MATVIIVAATGIEDARMHFFLACLSRLLRKRGTQHQGILFHGRLKEEESLGLLYGAGSCGVYLGDVNFLGRIPGTGHCVRTVLVQGLTQRS